MTIMIQVIKPFFFFFFFLSLFPRSDAFASLRFGLCWTAIAIFQMDSKSFQRKYPLLTNTLASLCWPFWFVRWNPMWRTFLAPKTISYVLYWWQNQCSMTLAGKQRWYPNTHTNWYRSIWMGWGLVVGYVWLLCCFTEFMQTYTFQLWKCTMSLHSNEFHRWKILILNLIWRIFTLHIMHSIQL